MRYALHVVVQKIQQLEETGHTDGPDGQNADKTFHFLCDMTRLTLLGLKQSVDRLFPVLFIFLGWESSLTVPDLCLNGCQCADVALHEHPQCGGGGREEGEAVQLVPALFGWSAQDLHNLPTALPGEDDTTFFCYGLAMRCSQVSNSKVKQQNEQQSIMFCFVRCRCWRRRSRAR